MKSFLTFFALLVACSLYSQERGDVVVMVIQQNYTLVRTDSYIRITDSSESTKTTALRTAGRKLKDSDDEANSKAIQKEIGELVKEGYSIKSSTMTGDVHFTTTVIIFQRE